MSDTIFHKILAGEIPCAKIYEDEHLFAFMDAFPQSKGHSLIIPKNFAPDLLTAHTESLQHIIVFSQKLARAQKRALAADGIKVVQYNGASIPICTLSRSGKAKRSAHMRKALPI